MGVNCDKKPGKHPIESAWQKRATTDKKQIRKWWAAHPDANFGVATGHDSGIFVVDIDGEKGFSSLAELEEKNGKLPETFTVQTGSGGLHFYFSYPDFEIRNKQGWQPGIDIRGEGGFVVGPLSTHVSGHSYEARNDVETMSFPLAGNLAVKEQPAAPVAPLVHSDQTKKASLYLAKMPPAISGSGGHDATYKAAVILVKGFSLSEDQALAMLMAEYNPRCQPAWTEKELRHKIKDAMRSSTLPDGFIANRPPKHLRAVPSDPFAAFSDFKPSSPPPLEGPPPPTDEDAPPEEAGRITADEFERLIDDDIGAPLKPEIFRRLMGVRDDKALWLRIEEILRVKRVKRAFTEEVKAYDRKNKRAANASADWEQLLIYKTTKSGDEILENNLANVAAILQHAPAWRGVISYDRFKKKIVKLKDPPHDSHSADWCDEDAFHAKIWLERNYAIRPNTKTVFEAIQVVAANCDHDPLKDYFLGLTDDHDHSIIDTWLTDFFGVEDTPYSRAVGKKWLVGAVKRAFEPGCKIDTVLILEGEQGMKKSRFLSQLCPNKSWFTDGLSEFGSKAQAEEVEGKWIIELGELKGFRKSDTDSIKAFITRDTENYRPAYARYSIESPRRCVFVGTVNTEGEYFNDPTGNRRFWPVKCTKQAPELTPKMRDQIWAEAYTIYKSGEEPWLSTPELVAEAVKHQEERVVHDVWHDKIEEFLEGKSTVHMDDVLNHLGVDVAKRSTNEQRRVGYVMKILNWTRDRMYLPNGRRVRCFRKPPDTQLEFAAAH
jgi:predicted P-loop ATPase